MQCKVPMNFFILALFNEKIDYSPPQLFLVEMRQLHCMPCTVKPFVNRLALKFLLSFYSFIPMFVTLNRFYEVQQTILVLFYFLFPGLFLGLYTTPLYQPTQYSSGTQCQLRGVEKQPLSFRH